MNDEGLMLEMSASLSLHGGNLTLINLFDTYMLFAVQEVCIGKNCARGLKYGPGPYARLRAQFFPVWTHFGHGTMCLFFSMELL